VVLSSVLEREGLGIRKGFRAETPTSHREEGFHRVAFLDHEAGCSDLYP